MNPPAQDDQPLGPPVTFAPPPLPVRGTLSGSEVTLRPLDPAADTPVLYPLTHLPDGDPRIWTYLFEGPFDDAKAMRADLAEKAAAVDRVFYVVELAGAAAGIVSYLRIVPQHGTIEIGNIWFSPALQRTRAATEAIFLLADHAFALGYRRLEWKCNALNAPSRAAALRFGFVFEGIFAQHLVVKGRSRDTAWFAITDDRWPALRSAFERWLAPGNFDGAGRQRASLRQLTGARTV